MDCLLEWPEPIVPVQYLSQSGSPVIPTRYVKPVTERPSFDDNSGCRNIPIIDLSGLSGDEDERRSTMDRISEACREWGFFQVINHGVSDELLMKIREVWREFFHLPLDEKKKYANSPKTYEGYGSRLGVEKGAILDWGDYFFLNYLPQSIRNKDKWPAMPNSCRKLVEEYADQVVRLGGLLLRVFSECLGLDEGHLREAFGGEEIGACMRVNFYPKCPQPDLTLGLSPHSDPGGMTLLLPDERIDGLQVRRGDSWVTVKAVQNSIIVNVGDQIQVLTNATYMSVEHRVIVNSMDERVSLAFFYNPKADILLGPIEAFVTPDKPALYQPMTFKEYRLYIRQQGPKGKSQVDSLKTCHVASPMRHS